MNKKRSPAADERRARDGEPRAPPGSGGSVYRRTRAGCLLSSTRSGSATPRFGPWGAPGCRGAVAFGAAATERVV